MGEGIGLKCSKCGRTYDLTWGSGFMFPREYRETLEAAKNGQYGPEWKQLSNEEKNVAIDAEYYIYSCRKCGLWKREKGLSLYAPKEISEIKLKKKSGLLRLLGITTEYLVRNRKEHPLETREYVMPYELEGEYRLLKRRTHKCDKCGGVMHKVKDKGLYNLPCPYCGGEPEKSNEPSAVIIN